jgi:protein dpy-30
MSSTQHLDSLPTRRYLDETVLPTLIEGMKELARVRPKDPKTWLAHYLLEGKAPESDRAMVEDAIEKQDTEMTNLQ